MVPKTHHDLPHEYAMPLQKHHCAPYFDEVGTWLRKMSSALLRKEALAEHINLGQTISPNGGMVL